MEVLDARFFNMAKFEVLMAHAGFGERFEGKIDSRHVDAPTGISRFMFIELLLRIAKFLYCTSTSMTQKEILEQKETDDQYSMIASSQAFHMFLTKKLLPFYKKNGMGQYRFRQDLLQHDDIEVIITMNERALK